MILINGDSWTGGRLPAVERKYWPDFLNEKVDTQLINLGIGGSSNPRIYRSTLDFLYSSEDKSIDKIIIGWSGVDRNELSCAFDNDPHPSSNYFKITPEGTYCKHQDVSQAVKDSIHRIYYKWCHSQNKNIKNFLLNAIALQDICKQRNIKLLNFFSFQDIFSMCNTEELIILKSRLNMDFWIKSTMQTSTLQFPVESSRHTNEDGNKFWAEVIFNNL
jgi:hypothetical protein